MAQKSEDKVQNEQEPEVSEKPDQAEDWQNAIEDAPDEDIPLNDDAKDVDDTFEALLQERDQLKDQLLRALAETENMRRRTERETQSARKYGHTSFARDLVGAIDNLARAIEAAGASGSEAVAADEATQSLIKGIELSWTEILSVIEKHGITQINPVGEKFDYNQHQAMFELPTDEHEPGMVVEVVQHGYMLHDRLLRPAMVGVSKAADKSDKQVDAKA
ncbi:MAG: nucleotide exchange factor GrpE [Alphaproteobacteria bacterium]|jgi:molecular chaperone GrpE